MWAKDSGPVSGVERFFSSVAFKFQVVLRSITAFVLMSTVTAMTVRTLLSSGVVVIFPMAMLMERMGLHGADMNVRTTTQNTLPPPPIPPFYCRFFGVIYINHIPRARKEQTILEKRESYQLGKCGQ